MAVFRIERNKGYTVMSNYHLNDKRITLKAKGLLSQMLSLPENWDYTLRGLAFINKESIDAIRTAVLELEGRGYILRKQRRESGGKLATIEYTIHEQPHPCLENPITGKPSLKKPYLDNPNTDNPIPENPTQVNTNIVNTEKVNTDVSKIYPSSRLEKTPDGIDGKSAMDVYEEILKDNIEYDILCQTHSRERVDEVLALMLDTLCIKRSHFRIGGQKYPAEAVKNRLLKLDAGHIEYVFECIDKNTTKVRNIKSYLLTTLYNAPATMDSYYRAEVNHDLYGSKEE